MNFLVLSQSRYNEERVILLNEILLTRQKLFIHNQNDMKSDFYLKIMIFDLISHLYCKYIIITYVISKCESHISFHKYHIYLHNAPISTHIKKKKRSWKY